MSTSPRAFLIELYQEYLEEASFLYEQRLTLFDDPEITWLDIEDFEDRFEPHIDGLVVGEELALEVCKQQAEEGDFGELHGAVRVFCRQNRQDLVDWVLEELDPDDDERVQAVSDALKYELPEDWQEEIIQTLADGDQKFLPILVDLIGHRRLDKGRMLLDALEVATSESLARIIWTLGRLRQEGEAAALFKYLLHEDEAVRLAAAMVLLRLGKQETITHCLQHAHSESWASIPLALGGKRSAVQVLLDQARASTVDSECLFALGLLGDISAIPILLMHLASPDLAEPAAMALNLITGAEIYEEAFIPEEIDEDELFEEELERFKEGEVPTRPEGQPFGITVEQISQDVEAWQRWWTENRSRFNPSVRYRSGKPYSPACLLENLEFERSPHMVRQLAYEELVIRYGGDFSFEADMLVAQQKKVLEDIRKWVQSNQNRFQDGAWYFAGQAVG